MDFSKMPLFQALGQKMQWLDARQRILAQNIGNSDTPGYKPLELKPFSFHSQLQQADNVGAPRRTNAKHLTGSHNANSNGIETQKMKDPGEVRPDGNAVVLEQQMMKLAENAAEYQMVTGVYRKAINLFRTAMGRRS